MKIQLGDQTQPDKINVILSLYTERFERRSKIFAEFYTTVLPIEI